MRFVTWNMGCGPGSEHRQLHDAAWCFLLDYLNPDIAFVQEALTSAEDSAADRGALVWSAVKPQGSGTAVFVRRGIPFTPIEAKVAGSYVAAIRTAVCGKPAEAVSVHVGPEKWANQIALGQWLVDTQFHAGPFVVGGDFNASRSYAPRHRRYLEGLSKSGLYDCHWSKHGQERASFWGRQGRKVKYQDDHFFTSGSLGEYVKACDVVDNALTRGLSDHGPLTLDLISDSG